MGAQAPAVLGNKLYLMTGSGAFDPPTDLGECLVELQYDPATASAPARLHATDWFAPFSDAARNGNDPTLPEPKNSDDGDGASNTNAFTDMDLGSGGLGIIPELGCALGAGKDGIVYVLPLGKFGKTLNADFAKTWPNITVKKEAPADSKEWDGKPDKEQFLSAEPGTGD